METGSAQAAESTPTQERPALEAPLSLLGAVRAVLGDLRVAVDSRAHLVSLELRRAGMALAQMVVLAVLAALMLCAAWIALMGGLFAGCVEAGLAWPWALLIVLAVNLGAAGVIWWRARKLTEFLGFPATRQMMKPTPKPDPLHTETAGPDAGIGMPGLRTQEAGHV